MEPPTLEDSELRLELLVHYFAHEPGALGEGWRFGIVRILTGEMLGHVTLRPMFDELHVCYLGQIGYGVEARHRGQGIAGRSVRLVSHFARQLGMTELWITTDPGNRASQQVLRKLGAEHVETVDVPSSSPLWPHGARRKTRWRLELGESAPLA